MWRAWRARQAQSQPAWYCRPFQLGGQPVHFIFRPAPSWGIQSSQEHIILSGPARNLGDEGVRNLAEQYLRSRAAEWLTSRLETWSAKTALHPRAVRIRDQKTRWGSCSAQGRINLNWRLALAPVVVADYVIVHELCHLRELNHSPRFWQLVEKWVPDHAVHRRWLREHGHTLYF
jgi:predicted metal-dependent hydrolase